jgi:hypothetical protein
MAVGKRKLPWPGWLHTESWAGSSLGAVLVVGEAAHKFIVEPSGDRVRLGGRYSWLEPGGVARVPKYAVSHRRWRKGERAAAKTRLTKGDHLVANVTRLADQWAADANGHAKAETEYRLTNRWGAAEDAHASRLTLLSCRAAMLGACGIRDYVYDDDASGPPNVCADNGKPQSAGDFVDGIYDGRHLIDDLHPNGRCTCRGEGRCAYCAWAREQGWRP